MLKSGGALGDGEREEGTGVTKCKGKKKKIKSVMIKGMNDNCVIYFKTVGDLMVIMVDYVEIYKWYY